MKKVILSTILILALMFSLTACNSDDWYGEYPEGFVPQASFVSSLNYVAQTPESLVERGNLILTGTVLDVKFEWMHLGGTTHDGGKQYEPMLIYTIAVNEVFKTDIEVGETIEIRAMTNYRDVILYESVPEKLNVGDEYLLVLGTFADRIGDPYFDDQPQRLMPITINPVQTAFSLQTDLPTNTIEANSEGNFRTVEPNLSDDTVFRASDILALFE